jgi:hypothetical protein
MTACARQEESAYGWLFEEGHRPRHRDCRFSRARGFDMLSLNGWGSVFKRCFPLTLSLSKGFFAWVISLAAGKGTRARCSTLVVVVIVCALSPVASHGVVTTTSRYLYNADGALSAITTTVGEIVDTTY